MTTLTKNKNTTFIPGVPGVAGKPGTSGTSGTPGSPGSPAYTETHTVSTPVYRTVTYSDSNGIHTRLEQVGTTTSTSYTYHPATPGTPPTPPVPGTPGTPGAPGTKEQFLTDNNIGWNAGAVSVHAVQGDGYLYFTAPASVIGEVVGLAYDNPKGDYRAIDYGLYLTKGSVAVVELGVSKTSISYVTGDVLRVQRLRGVITYSKNETTFYVSLQNSPSTRGLAAAASIYAAGDAVSGAALFSADGAFVIDYLGGQGGAGALWPLTGFGANGPHAQSLGVLLPLTGSGSERTLAGANSVLLPLTGIGANYGYQYSTASMLGLQGSSHPGEFAPNYGLADTILWPLQSWAHGLTGELGHGDTVMRSLKGFGSDHNYAESRGEMLPLAGSGGEAAILSGWGVMTLADGYQLNASGTRQNFNAYNGAMPAFTFRAFGGANAKLALPHPTLMATGVGVVVGRAALDMPTPMLAAAGFGGSVGEASLILTGGYTVRAFSGAVVAVTLQDGYTLHASGTAGSVGGAALTMPLFELTAAGSVNGLSSAVLTMPMLRPVPSGVARLTLPYGFALFAAGSATVAVTYEAYAVNLLTALDRNPQNQYDPDVREVTHYTNFPFNQIVRFNNHYYGVADDGLYLLEGDTDNGTAIPWKFRTTLTDAGSKQKKRIKSLYFGARLHSQVTVTLVVGEKQDQEYSYTTPRDATAQSYRQKFGKGIKTRYFAIEVGDTAGNFAEFDALDTEREILERTL